LIIIVENAEPAMKMLTIDRKKMAGARFAFAR
jgi:hypothetical protein